MDYKQQYEIVKNEIARPLSNHEIDKWLRSNGILCNFYAYNRLEPDMKLHDLFSRDGCAIILYNIADQNTGHWCCLIRHNKDTVEFFDPYSSKLDANLKYSNNRFPTITAILKNNNVKNVVFNNMRFQRMNNAIATCGRHCAFRVLMKGISLEEYQTGFLNSDFEPKLYDYYIYLLTSDILEK